MKDTRSGCLVLLGLGFMILDFKMKDTRRKMQEVEVLGRLATRMNRNYRTEFPVKFSFETV